MYSRSHDCSGLPLRQSRCKLSIGARTKHIGSPMKIFISHSSYDKWIARKISADLIKLGFETFLDEKDIKTGESIDQAIGQHLRDCDELLLLLSPQSKGSNWVFIEIGGAKALSKGVATILINLGANDVPS